ncbi:winged helix-turn-helix transcriptional regulator [Mycobacteroides chelonae]|uniref:winged helix-turn-helix transcriptional regulator n=1 Tax=Mycobacteroides chelonae TaxID=1774 RepID=UPI0009BC9ADF|nr:helix-turn-helix domain-containing protein [Mycobacteroides chelonae]
MERSSAHLELFADCRLRAVFDLFAHRWDLVVMAALHEGACRRSDLHERIGEVSDKVLTESLRRLLGSGLLTRRRYEQVPRRVEYELTPLGMSLVEGPMAVWADWIDLYGDEILAAQENSTKHLRSQPGG